ncbi:MAG: response regulator transcription factor [Hyphomicrobiales bacterium]
MQAVPLILIVDDDAAVLNSLSFMLEAEGFEVRAFGDIGELIAAESMPKVDCLILDYRMPVMNGFDVLQWLREQKVTAPAILITGHPDRTLRSRARAAGFARVVEKPLLENELVDDIRQVLPAV